MEKEAFEQTGLVPRSIIRTFDRFTKQLLPGAETSVLQEFRISRYQVLVSVRCLLILIFIPMGISFLAKTLILNPLTQYVWNENQTEIFLNSYQQEKALIDMANFEERIYFQSLCDMHEVRAELRSSQSLDLNNSYNNFSTISHSHFKKNLSFEIKDSGYYSSISTNEFQENFQQKLIEIAKKYNQDSINAITNLFADLITFVTISILFILMRPQIIILKSFLTESIYSLSDTTKSFLLILFTDLLVGFHSPRGWEFFLELFIRHFGLSENQDFILLFVATFPVLLDTVFKYWIFRYLNKISPSTVATYHNMIE
jgi:hypothetical protein|uniref:Potassium/proton antiporter CemA n=1 Tax=Binuclearia lauterbornii TaxID=3087189 RepID=A0A097KP54_9CHLO|nr:chloroplast enveloppe membrane protein [Binuclearia lauterbornii]AIT94994.1 chloroplast enveloppe membrane protein [Binuclearia lauterbornii]